MESVEDFKREIFKTTGINFDVIPDWDPEILLTVFVLRRRGPCYVVFKKDPLKEGAWELENLGVIGRFSLEFTPSQMLEWYNPLCF